MKTRVWVAGLVLSSAAVAAAGFACSSSSSASTSCTCPDPVCKTGTACSDGFACVTDTVVDQGGAVTQCRAQCPDGKTGCALDEHCGNDNVCHAGASPPGVTFDTTQPRPCGAFQDCPFAVKTFGGSGQIDHYDWTFDDDGGVTTTTAPNITHKYPPGSHTTTCAATDKNGTKATAETTDDICVDGVAIQCTAGVVDCCQGTCNPEGGCS